MAVPSEQDLFVSLASEAFDGEAFRVFRVDGREAISELFRFDIEVALIGDRSAAKAMAPGELLTLTFERRGQVVRQIHGMIESIRHHVGSLEHQPTYRIRLVPRASRLALVACQHVFLGKSVPEIIRDKLDLVGLSEGGDFSLSLGSSYPALEFVVQYCETDLAFVSRRAEHLGISYFFVPSEGVDKMIFVDGDPFPPLSDAPALPISSSENDPNRVITLEQLDKVTPALYLVQDYNYRRPDLTVSGQATIAEGGGGFAAFGDHVKTPEEAAAIAAVRAEEIGCRRRSYRGKSTVLALTAGHRTEIEESGTEPAVPLLLAAVEHHVSLPLSGDSAAGAGYYNEFEATDPSITFRPLRLTPRPVIPGVVTGIVQGESHASPLLDSEGRYVVQVHFETALGERAGRSSHLVRMAQPYGGTGHGMHFPLRPGTEVLLAFTNGDPDRPILLASIPNALTRSPVTNAEGRLNRIVTQAGALMEIGESS